MLSKELNERPSDRPIILDNISCPYCGVILSNSNDTKEHVIGRRFVPKGTLNGFWNLIVRACEKCNSRKSNLENDISAITLVGKMWFGSNGSEDKVIEEAQRKSKNSISHETKKPVIHSQEELNLEVPFAQGVTFKFNMMAPPRIDRHRLYDLARLHMMAFFYFISYDYETKKGGFWPEGFHPLSDASHSDWGNSLHQEFMVAVLKWKPCWVGITADGYFKSIIRRHPNAECWSWALEWNKNYRVIGFFGSRLSAQEIVNNFQSPKMTAIVTGENSHISYRSNVKQSEEDDMLFVWDDDNA